MQAIVWAIRIIVGLFLVWFAVKNAQTVTVHGLADYTWQAPLVLVLLVFFAGGVVIGLLASLGSVFKLRRELSQAKKQAKNNAAAIAAGNAPHGP